MPDFGIFRGFNEKLFGDKLYAGQLPTQLGLIGSEEVRDFDIDAEAFFDRVTFAGGTLSLTEQLAINTLVKQMKLDGIWTKMKAIYPMVGASAAACSQNLKSSSFTGTFNGGWTFASTGVKGNGTNSYLNTNLNILNNLIRSNNNISIYCRTNALSNNTATDYIGGDYLNVPHYIQLKYINTLYMQSITPEIGVSNANSQGFYQMNRQNSTLVQVIKNNSILTTRNNDIGSVNLNNANAFFGVFLYDGVLTNYSREEYSLLSLGDGLTDTEASNFYTSVQAFQTFLSRNV